MIKYIIIISLFIRCVPDHHEYIDPDSMPMYYILYRPVIKIKFLQPFVSWNKVYNFLTQVGVYQEMLFWSLDEACEIAKDFQEHPNKL